MSDLLKISRSFEFYPNDWWWWTDLIACYCLKTISVHPFRKNHVFFYPWHRRCFIRPKPSQIVVEGSGLYRYLELQWFSISSGWVEVCSLSFFQDGNMEIRGMDKEVFVVVVSWWFTHGFMYIPVNEHSWLENGPWMKMYFLLKKSGYSSQLCEFTRGYP